MGLLTKHREHMDALAIVKTHYQPVQPSVQPSGLVSYLELVPDPRLQLYIHCYWQLKTNNPLKEPFVYRVVADGCIDVFFEPGQSQESFVMGFCKQYTEFELDRTFNYVGIRFLPTMFPRLFNVDAASLSNRTEPLAAVVPSMASFLGSCFTPDVSIEHVQLQLDTYFLHHMVQVNSVTDLRLYNALATIIKRSGTLNVEKDIDCGISPRQLRRLFKFYIGDTAKTFSKIVRFQQVLRTGASFYDAGYYDQAHFIKDFRHFSGVTPKERAL